MVMFLDEARVAELLSWERLIPAMEQALAEFSQGRVLQPVRQMLTIEAEERYLGIMPAVAEEAMGLKLVSFYPRSEEHTSELQSHSDLVCRLLLEKKKKKKKKIKKVHHN